MVVFHDPSEAILCNVVCVSCPQACDWSVGIVKNPSHFSDQDLDYTLKGPEPGISHHGIFSEFPGAI